MQSPLQLLSSEPLAFAMLAVSLVLALSLHEFAHAFAADLQGDRLPRAMGRISLNPVRHLDPLGTILLLLVGFGWAKPVEFRPSALRSQRFGAAIVALAGPMMNLALAVLGFVGLRVTGFDPLVGRPEGLAGQVATFWIAFASINILLAVFNLIPLPPLDGSRLLTIFLPPKRHNIIFFLDRYGFLILLGLLFFGGFTFLQPIIQTVGRSIAQLVF
ncbi:MAG: site-2 protease family protein [Actinomycetota bacterium]